MTAPNLADECPTRCLSLTVRGPYGHFRRVDGSVAKRTYRVMPRTTVAGLLAAIVGVGRDEYYETFTLNESAIAITPYPDSTDETVYRTINVGTNSVTTSEENLKRPGGSRSRKGVKVRYPNSEANRQQYNYEMLVDPAYRIDVALTDDEFYENLRDKLKAGQSCYTPTLGLSECLATVEYHGETTDVEPVTDPPTVEVASAVPDVNAVVPQPASRVTTEQSPSEMSKTNPRGRKTTGFTSYAFEAGGGPLTVRTEDVTVGRVDGDLVAFN